MMSLKLNNQVLDQIVQINTGTYNNYLNCCKKHVKMYDIEISIFVNID